jgi:hypothetical protein
MKNMKQSLVLVGLVACGSFDPSGKKDLAEGPPPNQFVIYDAAGNPATEGLGDPMNVMDPHVVAEVPVPGQTVKFWQVPTEQEDGSVTPSFIVMQQGRLDVPSYVDALQSEWGKLGADALFQALLTSPRLPGFDGVALGSGDDTSLHPVELDHVPDAAEVYAESVNKGAGVGLDPVLDAFLVPDIAGHHWVNVQVSVNDFTCGDNTVLGVPIGRCGSTIPYTEWSCSGRSSGDLVYYGLPTLPKSCDVDNLGLVRITAMNLPGNERPADARSFIAQEYYGSGFKKAMSTLPSQIVNAGRYVVADWDLTTAHRLGIGITTTGSARNVVRFVTGNNIPN